MSITRVLSAADQIAQTAEQASRAFARELARVLRDTERQLGPLVRHVSEGSRTAIVKAALANKTRREIRAALEVSGFDTLAETALGPPLDRLTERVLTTRRLAQATARLSGAFDQRLEALKLLHLSDLLDEGDAVARALWQATTRGVFGSRSADAILADLGDVLDYSEPQIRTLYDTSVSIYGRQVEALQSGDSPDTTFAFFGPVDERTREFCLKHVGKVYTHAEIDALDNGQIDNVFLTGGGYNCRHQWTEVSRFSELQDLGKARVPEVQDQLDELAAAA